MKTRIRSCIVEGGGWTVTEVIGRKRARFFGLLSAACIPISAGASYPFWSGVPESFGTIEWISSVLLGAHSLLIALAIVHAIIEKPGPMNSLRRESDYDPHKLY